MSTTTTPRGLDEVLSDPRSRGLIDPDFIAVFTAVGPTHPGWQEWVVEKIRRRVDELETQLAQETARMGRQVAGLEELATAIGSEPVETPTPQDRARAPKSPAGVPEAGRNGRRDGRE